MTRNRASALVLCENCGTTRLLKHPALAGSQCRRCAARLGSAAAAVVNRKNPLDRFAEYVALTEAGCWTWIGVRQPNGYGSFGVDGTTLRAHRWAYEHFVGPIPDGLEIDHLCRNRACVNPNHLEPATRLENARRAMRSACINGHDFTEENTYTHGGKRYCRECRRLRNRRHRAA